MDNCAKADTKEKHVNLHHEAVKLGDSLKQLEALIDRIEGSETPAKPTTVDAGCPPLSTVLSELPDRLENYTTNVSQFIIRLENLLFLKGVNDGTT